MSESDSTKLLESIKLDDLPLPIEASGMMAYEDPVMRLVGDTLIVGYLVDDHHAGNPLEDVDGLGHIYQAHRHSSTQRDMQEALALDSSWDPDLELVENHMDHFRKAWVAAAVGSDEFRTWAIATAGHGALFTDAYFRRRAIQLWRETDGEYYPWDRQEDIYDFEFTREVKKQVWEDLRDSGLIGDQNAVLLDVYEHSGQAWSISGTGFECRWDTSRGAGVWVPDEIARGEIERRSKVYAYGRVLDNGKWTRGSGKKRYYAELDERYGGGKSPQFTDWYLAFAWLEEVSKRLKAPRSRKEQAKVLAQGRWRAAVEIAECALEVFNDWLAGRTYGIVSATFRNIGTSDKPEFEFVGSEDSWGFIGEDSAMEEVTSWANAKADRMVKEAA